MTSVRRACRVTLDPEMLLRLMTDGNELHARVGNGVPVTARLLAGAFDAERNEFVLYVEHDSFEPTVQGERIPAIHPTLTHLACQPVVHVEVERVGSTVDPCDVELGGGGGTE